MCGGYRAATQQTIAPIIPKPGEDDGKKDDGKKDDTKTIIKTDEGKLIGISVGSAVGGLATGILAGLAIYNRYQKNRRNNEPIIPPNRGVGYGENVYERQPSIGLQTSFRYPSFGTQTSFRYPSFGTQTSFSVNDLPPLKNEQEEFSRDSLEDERDQFVLFDDDPADPLEEPEKEEDPQEFKYNTTYNEDEDEDVSKWDNEKIDRKAAEVEKELSRLESQKSVSNISSRRSNPSRNRLGDTPELPQTSRSESERSVGYVEPDIVTTGRVDTAGVKKVSSSRSASRIPSSSTDSYASSIDLNKLK